MEALETALDQMIGALKADLKALRADLVLLRANDARPARSPSAEHPRPGSGAFSAHQTRKISSPGHSFKEESLPPKKKDPRADE